MRAQISLELIIIMGFAVALLVSMLIVGSVQLSAAATDSRQNAAIDVAQTIQQELLTAYTMHDGYTRVFSLPQRLTQKSYSIILDAENGVGAVTVQVAGVRYSERTPPCNGTLFPGTNTLRKVNNTLWCNS